MTIKTKTPYLYNTILLILSGAIIGLYLVKFPELFGIPVSVSIKSIGLFTGATLVAIWAVARNSARVCTIKKEKD